MENIYSIFSASPHIFFRQQITSVHRKTNRRPRRLSTTLKEVPLKRVFILDQQLFTPVRRQNLFLINRSASLATSDCIGIENLQDLSASPTPSETELPRQSVVQVKIRF